MQLSQFNQQPIQDTLQHCVNIPRWADEIVNARPFLSVQAALDFARQQANTWTWQEILAALNTHPRIGEKKAQAELSAKEQAFSAREQAAAQQSDQKTLDALLQGNLNYEARFGYIFLIKAAGLSSQQILAALNRRLNNDATSEQAIVKQQLIEIALLRLEQELEHD
jgi:2-oxo-4-hydroxy-4-carboxy-5-ureidoimidazoline decarboxylase